MIFDVDGVLVDSYQAHYDSWQVVAREARFEFTERRFIDTFGRTTREILRGIFGEGGITAERITELDLRKEAAYRGILSQSFPAMAGAAPLIDACVAAGFPLAVGSSGPPENVQLVLERLGRAASFRAVVTGTDVTLGKPHPQVFLLAAERLGLPAERCVVVEDAPAGIEAARRAGMKCIGFVSRGHTFAELAAADRCVASLEEISPELARALLAA
jgi:beta-phosphoglucomutase